jgi:hypothetical protein
LESKGNQRGASEANDKNRERTGALHGLNLAKGQVMDLPRPSLSCGILGPHARLD